MINHLFPYAQSGKREKENLRKGEFYFFTQAEINKKRKFFFLLRFTLKTKNISR
jgi:hypothetical protein